MNGKRKVWYASALLSLTIVVYSCYDGSRGVAAPGTLAATSSPRLALSSEFTSYEFLGWVKDDNGANDTPAQSDLNAFTRADNVAGKIGVQWVWDDVNSWTGSGQTGDACALFDTDADGKANYAACVRITNLGGDPTVIAQLAAPDSPLLYSCGDSKKDRCASPTRLVPLAGTVCEVQKIAGETFFTAGDDGADVLAACSIPLSAMSTSVTPGLLNVCSFPSGSPNSNPFDCVVTPGAGFVIIKKATTPQASGKTFSFTIDPAVVSGASQSVTDNTSGVEQTALLSATPGTYSITEGALPTGWELDAASCLRQTTATGTKTGSAVTGIAVTSGATTTCTFTNKMSAPSVTVVKTAGAATVPETGGNVTFDIVVTNGSSIAVTLDSLVDNVFGKLNGVGTCNGASNAFGSIASSGTYSCAITKALGPAKAGDVHVDTVTAYVSSDGGPASAKDSAKVTFTDVKPDITVTKSADVTEITATGGVSVANFTADVSYARSSISGTSTPIFASDVCDDAGANDQPAQVDLNCFSRADNVTGRLYLKWTWDDVDAWTGTGQTGDGCALLDTDGNGMADYSLCASITNPNGDPTVIAMAPGSPTLYECKDGANDRCTSKVLVRPLDATSVCSVSLVDQYFAAGDDGKDTQALCNLRLQDLGNAATAANTRLLNVCSFPSGSPNSNPFDCVVTPAAGFLVIAKTTTPTNADAFFGYQLRNGDNTANASATNGYSKFAVQGGATSAPIPILPGTYALTELFPTGWSLNSISCTRDGATIGTTSGTTRSSLTIVQGATTSCTFVNSLTASQRVTFTVTVTNNSDEAVTLYSLEDTENPDDTTPTYTTLDGVGKCATGGTIVKGTPYTCTFTRTITGSPGYTHKDKVRAVGKDNDGNSDTELSSVVTVTIK